MWLERTASSNSWTRKCEEILKENQRSVSSESVPDCFKLSSETRSSPPAFLDIGDKPVREEVPLF